MYGRTLVRHVAAGELSVCDSLNDITSHENPISFLLDPDSLRPLCATTPTNELEDDVSSYVEIDMENDKALQPQWQTEEEQANQGMLNFFSSSE